MLIMSKLFLFPLVFAADSILSLTSCFGFSLKSQSINNPANSEATATISSTLLSSPGPGPLSMGFEEFSSSLGGKGRAMACWDLYRIGVDPMLYFSEQQTQKEQQEKKENLVYANDYTLPILSFLESASAEISLNDDIDGDDFNVISSLIAKRRQTQGLGKQSLKLLSKLYPENNNKDDNITNNSRICGIEENVGSIAQISQAKDGTTKLLVQLKSQQKRDLKVETVIIPFYVDEDDQGNPNKDELELTKGNSKRKRQASSSTLCISSEVGCAQGCRFCATGSMGLLYDLTSEEILSQVFLARKVCRIVNQHLEKINSPSSSNLKPLPPIDNIVFMGMGEPAANLINVKQAAKILTERNQFSFAQTKVTISTVAPSPQSFLDLADAPCALAWSVHAVNDKLRKQLVPTTKYSMQQLRQGFIEALNSRPQKKLRTTMLEVALMDQVNDTEECALELVDFCNVLKEEVEGIKLVVNLIPYNDIGNGVFKKPSNENVLKFQEVLVKNKVFCFIRTTRGDDSDAACGQLVTKKIKRKANTTS